MEAKFEDEKADVKSYRNYVLQFRVRLNGGQSADLSNVPSLSALDEGGKGSVWKHLP